MSKIYRNNVCTPGDPYSWPACCSVRFLEYNHQKPESGLPHLRYAPLHPPLPQVPRVDLPNFESSPIPHPHRPPFQLLRTEVFGFDKLSGLLIILSPGYESAGRINKFLGAIFSWCLLVCLVKKDQMIKGKLSPYLWTTSLSPTMIHLKVSLLMLDLILRLYYEWDSVRRVQEIIQDQTMNLEACKECRNNFKTGLWTWKGAKSAERMSRPNFECGNVPRVQE